jgi:cysteine desulfurase
MATVNFIFHTTRQTIKAEEVLRRNSIDYMTTAIPKSIALGCTIALVLDESQAKIAEEKLTESSQLPEKIFDEKWQPKSGGASAAGSDDIYLDNNATTPIDPAVVVEMLPFFETNFGNPSSIYKIGRTARSALRNAREKVAALVGADAEEIVFTSCGTEANNTAIIGAAYALEDKGRHIITSQIEHKSVLNSLKFLEQRGFEVTCLPVDENGLVELDRLESAIRDDTTLISIMFANNEIGVVQPVAEIAGIADKHGTVFHTDAVQAAGKIKIDVAECGCSLLSLSAHKICGPKGVGALYVRTGTPISPIILGGKQEGGLRGGTENVAGIVGFGKAAELASNLEQSSVILQLRDKLQTGLQERVPGLLLNGHPQKRLPNTLNVSIPDIEAEALVINLDLKGIYISTGSACTSGAIEPSHVLCAIGRDNELAKASIRFSLGRLNTESEIDKVIETLPAVVKRLRALGTKSRSGL